MTIHLYSADSCGYCVKAKQLLDKHIKSGYIVVKDSSEAKNASGVPLFECQFSGKRHTGLPASIQDLNTKLGRDPNSDADSTGGDCTISEIEPPCGDGEKCIESGPRKGTCVPINPFIIGGCKNSKCPSGQKCDKSTNKCVPDLSKLYVDKNCINDKSMFFLYDPEKHFLYQQPIKSITLIKCMQMQLDVYGPEISVDNGISLSELKNVIVLTKSPSWNAFVKEISPLFPCTTQSDWSTPDNIPILLQSGKLDPPTPCKNDKSVLCCRGEDGPKFLDVKTIVLISSVALLAIVVMMLLLR